MDWNGHDRWAVEKLGVPANVSQTVNTIIDAVENGGNIPSEYDRHLAECAEQETDTPKKRGSMVNTVIALHAKKKHDASRGGKTASDLSARVHRCAMRRMGEEYVMAWYLHHHLDYFDENSDSGKRFDQILMEYKTEYPLTHSQYIEDFLTKRKEEVISEFDL